MGAKEWEIRWKKIGRKTNGPSHIPLGTGVTKSCTFYFTSHIHLFFLRGWALIQINKVHHWSHHASAQKPLMAPCHLLKKGMCKSLPPSLTLACKAPLYIPNLLVWCYFPQSPLHTQPKVSSSTKAWWTSGAVSDLSFLWIHAIFGSPPMGRPLTAWVPCRSVLFAILSLFCCIILKGRDWNA